MVLHPSQNEVMLLPLQLHTVKFHKKNLLWPEDLFLLFCKSELFAKLFAYIIHHTFINYEFWVLLSLLLYISSTKKSKTLCAQGWYVHLFSPRMQSWYLLMFCEIMASSKLIQIKNPQKMTKQHHRPTGTWDYCYLQQTHTFLSTQTQNDLATKKAHKHQL